MGVSVGSSIYNAPSIYESGAGGGISPEPTESVIITSLPEGFESIDVLEIKNYSDYGILIPMNSGFRSSFVDTEFLKFKINFKSDFSDLLDTILIQEGSLICTGETFGSTLRWNNSIIGNYDNRIILTNYVDEFLDVVLSYDKFIFKDIERSIVNPKRNIDKFCVGANNWGNRALPITLKKIEITYNDNIICLCSPVVRISDQVKGMFDIISEDFFICK